MPRRSPIASEVAAGVHRLGTRWANFYLVVDGQAALLVDAGYPGYSDQLELTVQTLGVEPAAVIVTHHHVDHAGTAEAARSRWGATVFAGGGDAAIVRGERSSHPPQGFWRNAWRPSMAAYLVHSARAGGGRYRPVVAVTTLGEEGQLDLPGRPWVIPTPGHTAGHCSVLLEESGVLFTGDALVNFDYASGNTGLGLHRFNEERDAALSALGTLARFDVETLLFGHGDPWTGGVRRAIEIAGDRAQ